MTKRLLSVVIIFFLATFVLSACNFPSRQLNNAYTSVPSSVPVLQSTPTPTPLCGNPYFPNKVGDRWEYAGTNSFVSNYTRTDTITSSSDSTFTQETTLADVTYSVQYNCSSAGITSANPIQQYAGALLSSPDSPVSVNLSSNMGTSLPAMINPGDTWQQSADFAATSQQLNVNGRFVFDYNAVGYENITLPSGTYNALRVNGTIRIEVTGLHILAETYTTTVWLVPEIGMVKSEGTSHVTGVNFTDSMQLTSFTPAP
ncbi:MAG TPA: hypothetical protein VLD65_03670 [Anaerolineales bacterium]|nr:hypothetical protein [Anaerolineales bacterium]